MQYICFQTSHELYFHDARQVLFSTFNRIFHRNSRTMQMVTTYLKQNSKDMVLLSDFLKLKPSSLKGLEKERMTLRFYQPLIAEVKRVAEAKNISVNLYLEQALVEKLKMDSLENQINDDIETYSLLQNKNIDELAYLKQLLNKTLQDNHKLKRAVDTYRRTDNGREFESFELF